jgi:hypothetical protein
MSREHQERRFPRMPAEIVVLVSKPEPPAAEGSANPRVVGVGGCCFGVPAPLGVASTIDLSLSIGGRVVSAVAQVVYEIPREVGVEVGVEFVRLDKSDRQFLRRFLEPVA